MSNFTRKLVLYDQDGGNAFSISNGGDGGVTFASNSQKVLLGSDTTLTLTRNTGDEVDILETVDTNISTVTSLITRVGTEEATRTTADASLTSRVSSEEVARDDADTSLTSRVSSEEVARDDADASLATRVTATHDLVILNNQAFVTQKTLTAQERGVLTAADSAITSNISSEKATREAADASLTSLVSSEEVARDDADASLTSRVSVEESTRADADESLATRVTTAVSSEASSRISAEDSLGTRITTEIGLRVAGDTSLAAEVSSVDARIDSVLLGAGVNYDTLVELVDAYQSADTTVVNNITALRADITAIVGVLNTLRGNDVLTVSLPSNIVSNPIGASEASI